METFDPKTLRKTIRVSPRVRAFFEQTKSQLRADRVANPPGAGKLRKLKGAADREAFQLTYDALAKDPAFAEDAQLYDRFFAKRHAAPAAGK